MNELTQELVKELFTYRKDGNLIRRVRTSTCCRVGEVAGSRLNSGYIQMTIKSKKYLLHRLIFLYHHGYLPEVVDHIDGSRFNNRVENLRPATKSQNSSSSKRKPGKSKYIGVYKPLNSHRYKATITVNKKSIHLGMFDTAEEARDVRREAEKKYFGDYCPIRIKKDKK